MNWGKLLGPRADKIEAMALTFQDQQHKLESLRLVYGGEGHPAATMRVELLPDIKTPHFVDLKSMEITGTFETTFQDSRLLLALLVGDRRRMSRRVAERVLRLNRHWKEGQILRGYRVYNPPTRTGDWVGKGTFIMLFGRDAWDAIPADHIRRDGRRRYVSESYCYLLGFNPPPGSLTARVKEKLNIALDFHFKNLDFHFKKHNVAPNPSS